MGDAMMKLHCKFELLEPFWSEDICVKIPKTGPKLTSTCMVSVLTSMVKMTFFKIFT